MNITGEHNKVIVTGTAEDKKILHVISYGDNSSYMHNFTNSESGYQSIFNLSEDGYYIVSEFILELDDDRTVSELIESGVKESVNILLLCNLEDCVNEFNKKLLDLMLQGQCIKENNIIKQERDFLFTSYSSLKYLGELNYFEEAQRLLDIIKSCHTGCLCQQ